jgi:hypothetical protein
MSQKQGGILKIAGSIKKIRTFTTKHYFTDQATIALLPKTTILFTIKTA